MPNFHSVLVIIDSVNKQSWKKEEKRRGGKKGKQKENRKRAMRSKIYREQERKELRLLVGSNLVRLSQLDEISLDSFQNLILPSLLEEVVGCRDVIGQEYLFDVIIQVFLWLVYYL